MPTNPNGPNCNIVINTVPERYICSSNLEQSPSSPQAGYLWYRYTFGTTTPSGETKTWSLISPPTGITINSSTGELIWNPIAPAFPIGPLYDPYVIKESGPITVRVSLSGACTGSFDEVTFNLSIIYIYPNIQNKPNTFGSGTLSYQITHQSSTQSLTDIWSLIGAPVGMTISPTGLLEWIIPNATTSIPDFNIKLTQTDIRGCSGSRTDLIHLRNNLDIFLPSPFNNPLGTATLPCGTSNFSLQVQSISTVPLTWSISGTGRAITDNPPNKMLISSTGLITWTPIIGVITSGPVTVTVSSPGCISASKTFTLLITALPSFNLTILPTSIPVYWEHKWTYILTSNNNGGYFQLLDHPGSGGINNHEMVLTPLSGNPTHARLDWIPLWDTLSSNLVRVRFFNSCNEFTDLTFTLFPMDPPYITSAPPTGIICSSFSYQVVTVPNPSFVHPYIYSLSGGQSSTSIPIANRMVISNTGLITWTPGTGVPTSGDIIVIVTNNGCGIEDRMIFTIPVVCGISIDLYDPIMHCCSCQEIFSHQMTSTPSSPSDVWSILGTSGINYPIGMTITTNGLLTWMPPHGTITSGPITIKVNTIYNEFATLTFTVPVNVGPMITSIAPSGINSILTQGVPFTFLLESTDPNNNLLLEPWSLLETIPSGMTITHITGDPARRAILSWMPSLLQSGLFNIRVRVTDQCSLSDNLIFDLRVVPEGVTPPVFITNPPLEACDCHQYVYEPNVSGSIPPLLWELLSGPIGMVINSTTGRVTWTSGLCHEDHFVGGSNDSSSNNGGHSMGGTSNDGGSNNGGHSSGGTSDDLCCGGEFTSGPVKIRVTDSIGSSETQEFFIFVCQCIDFEPIYGHKMRSNVTTSGTYLQLTGNVYDIPAKFTLCEKSLITHGNTSFNFLPKTFHVTSTGYSVLNMPVILVIYYTDVELATMGPLSEDRLKGLVWNPVTVQWDYLKTKVYPEYNKVEIEINQLIGADYNLVKIAPVPVEISNLSIVQMDLSTLDATVEFNARDIDMDDVKLTYQWKLTSAPSNTWKVAKTTPPLSRIGGNSNFIMYSILWTVKKEQVFINNSSSQSVMFRIIANDDDGTTTIVDSSPFTIVLSVPLLALINPNIPKIISKPKTSVRVGDIYIYEPEADKKSNISYWQVTGLPSFLSFNTVTGNIIGTPTLTYLGTYIITLKVFTTLGRMNTQVFTLTIKKK